MAARILKAVILLSDNAGQTQSIDAIEHEGKVWIVPQWFVSRDKQWLTPERAIRVDALPSFRRSPSPEHQFSLQSPIPRAALFGPIATAKEIGFEVLEGENIPSFPALN